jgi:hypothetical protein
MPRAAASRSSTSSELVPQVHAEPVAKLALAALVLQVRFRLGLELTRNEGLVIFTS